MVHAPVTSPTKGTGRRGRPPKYRDPVVQPTPTVGPNGEPAKPTFISSLGFKVDGVVPIPKSPSPPPPEKLPESPKPTPTPANVSGSATNPSPLYESARGRAPRKSKMDAMAAISARSVSPTSEAASKNGPASSATPSGSGGQGANDTPPVSTLGKQPTRPSVLEVPLDLSSVKLPNRSVDPPRPTPRPFGLEDCPIFYPTAEEFKDPMAYVKSISGKASQYGICKVVPPEGWNMPFVTDTKSFRFKTRLQRLNSIEASSRAKLNFLEQLYRFHQQQEQVGPVVPTINHKPLDLWLLRREVHNRGGYDAVSHSRSWGEISRAMGLEHSAGISTQLKNAYNRIIVPFEQFSEHIRNSPAMVALSPANFRVYGPPSTPRGRMGATSASALPARMSRMRQNASLASAAIKSGSATRRSTPMSISSSGLSEPPEDAVPSVQTAIKIEVTGPGSLASDVDRGSVSAASKSPHGPSVPLPQMLSAKERPSHYVQGDTCEVCDSGDRGTEMLLCDGCDRGYHTFCLDPPLKTVPKGQWFCHICLFDTGGDYGFDEGEEHSLFSFQARDLAFRKAWFGAHPPKPNEEWDDPRKTKLGNVETTEDDVEREFWRLVESPLETVEIEYGADVHSTTHGSASPSLETHPLDPYSRDGWNVNNMPIVSDSLLRYVKSDISGMTVPWIYVGMIFSTFCWHNEDHYTYSVNYMHWGETKTWYGVPGEDAEKFEAAIKSEAPDLFDAQPDLLFQLVTLMSPKRLKEAGVRVVGCNQRPGEYVITFPKAYHAGFNHGLNLNEAVNFAMPDWLNEGRDCVRRYQEHQKLPVFSHEELLITITQHSSTIKTATWLLGSLRDMVDHHLALREKFRIKAPRANETLEEQDVPEDQYQCAICKGFTYLAQVTCDCTKQVACLEHWESLCSCPHSNHVLRKRFDDSQLLTTLATVEERSQAPETWRSRLRTVLTSTAKPELEALKQLVQDAEDMNVDFQELPNLIRFLEEVADLERQAVRILASRKLPVYPKISGRSKSRDTRPLNPVIVHGEYSIEDVEKLCNVAANLAVTSETLIQFQGLKDWVDTWSRKTAALLAESAVRGPRAEYDRETWEEHFKEAFAHNVKLPGLSAVEKVIRRIRLIEELKEVQDQAMTLEDVRDFSRQGDSCDLPYEHQQSVILRERRVRGEEWYVAALSKLEQKILAISELDELVSPPPTVPIMPSILERIDAVRARARSLEKQAKAMLAPPPGKKTRIQDALELVANAEKEFVIPIIPILRDLAKRAVQMERNCADIIQKRYTPAKPLFEELRDMRTDAHQHLHMFSMHNFDNVDQQLTRHDAWLEKLPWYRTPEPAMQGKLIVDDVLASTRPGDDQPPLDPDIGCICPLPVRVTMDRQQDAVQCDHCCAKFHAKCVAGSSCPFCDHHHWNGSERKVRNFEYTDLLPIAREAPELTRNYSLAWKHLDTIITYVDRLSRVIDAFLVAIQEKAYPQVLPTVLAHIKHFMRKLFKMQFKVRPRFDAPPYGLTLCYLHRNLANKIPKNVKRKVNRRPKFIFSAEIVQQASDGSRCLCLGGHIGKPTVACSVCSYRFHAYCVRFDDSKSVPGKPYRCPLCTVRKGKSYPYCEVRVRNRAEDKDGVYIDYKRCMEQCSPVLHRFQLEAPKDYCLVLDMEKYVPGKIETEAGPPPPAPPTTSGPSRTAVEDTKSSVKADHSVASSSSTVVTPALTARALPPPAPSPSVASKRKEPPSPPTDNVRRLKLVFREDDKTNGNSQQTTTA